MSYQMCKKTKLATHKFMSPQTSKILVIHEQWPPKLRWFHSISMISKYADLSEIKDVLENVEVENILKLTMRLTIGTVESCPAVLTVTSVSSRCVDAVGPIHTGITQTLIDIYNVHYT